MSKIIKVLIFVAILWIVSYGVAIIMFGSSAISVGEEIIVIPVHGMITLNGGSNLLQQSTSATDIVERIEDANEDSSVKGIVLDINSPGGTVMGSKRIADAVKKVDKPTVAVISETGASGAYWVASQTDLIIADELSIVGSLGVMGSYLDFSGLLNSYNITYNRLVTGDYKDISSPMKKLTDEERALIEERLFSIHNYFIQDVASGRNMELSEIEPVAEGLFYLGMEAVDLGLVDELGDKDYAIDRTKELANVTNGHVEEFEEEDGFFAKLKDYTAYSSFYIGQGIGSVLISGEMTNNIKIFT